MSGDFRMRAISSPWPRISSRFPVASRPLIEDRDGGVLRGERLVADLAFTNPAGSHFSGLGRQRVRGAGTPTANEETLRSCQDPAPAAC